MPTKYCIAIKNTKTGEWGPLAPQNEARFFYDTQEEAQEIAEFTKYNNSPLTFDKIWGTGSLFTISVAPIECNEHGEAVFFALPNYRPVCIAYNRETYEILAISETYNKHFHDVTCNTLCNWINITHPNHQETRNKINSVNKTNL